MKAQDQLIANLSKKAADQLVELNHSNSANQAKDKAIKDLQNKSTALGTQLQSKTEKDLEVQTQIQQTAQMYANMNPSKSAAIIQNLTLLDQVLIFSEMKPADQVKILEKMDPLKAANASIAIKDLILAKDSKIAALQKKIKLYAAQTAKKLTKNDLGLTFAQMAPKSAATVLLQMYSSSPSKVIDILSAMAIQPRSLVLSAIAVLSNGIAATISTKLAP